MSIKKPTTLVHDEMIESKIYYIREKKVMIDRDLAAMYGVPTKALNQAVRRNISRFPKDFMFKLYDAETKNLRSQIVTSSLNYGGRRYLPYVFTEQGVAMLSSVINSDRAIQVNIQIMRMFTKLREMLETHKELKEKIEQMEKTYDENFAMVFRAIKQLFETDKEKKSRRKIGYKLN